MMSSKMLFFSVFLFFFVFEPKLRTSFENVESPGPPGDFWKVRRSRDFNESSLMFEWFAMVFRCFQFRVLYFSKC